MCTELLFVLVDVVDLLLCDQWIACQLICIQIFMVHINS